MRLVLPLTAPGDLEVVVPVKRRGRKEAAAQAAFVSEVQQALPADALKQLCALRGSRNVAGWAKRWWSDAPCMIACATHVRTFAVGLSPRDRRRLIQGTLRGEVTVPETEWMPDLRRLDALPLSAFREGLADRMEGDYLKTYRRQRLVDDAISLAPLSADPLRETLGHFIQ